MEKFSKKRAAQQLYTEEEFDISAIAQLLSIDSDTVKEWAYRGKWQQKKDSNQLSNTHILKLVMEEFKQFLEQGEGVGTKLRLDTINAYRATISELKNSGVSPIEAVQLCNQLNDYFIEVGSFDNDKITEAISAFLNKYYLID